MHRNFVSSPSSDFCGYYKELVKNFVNYGISLAVLQVKLSRDQ